MNEKNVIITILVGVLLFFWYQRNIDNVNLQNHGQKMEAAIIEVQPNDGYTYIRFKYNVAGKEYLKGLRKYDNKKYIEGEKISFFILPEKPDTPFVNADKESLNRDIYYLLCLGAALLVYRTIRIMVSSTRQNYS
ncbi:MAG: hypothetical protein HQM09_06265 [Candidatus Riflebacteria bacterium]|nr:hypothetical protein [Candidatus Riflebacteria bacterium]